MILSYSLLKLLSDLGDSVAWFVLEYCLDEVSRDCVFSESGKILIKF